MRQALRYGALALLLSGMTIVLVGCGGDDGKKPPAATTGGTASADGFGKMPDWVPVFPDPKNLQLIEDKKDGKEFAQSVTYSFTTAKSPLEVKEFYEKGFEAAGFKKEQMSPQSINDDGVKQENLKGTDGKRIWFTSARLEKDAKETIVSLVYQIKKE